MYDLVLEGGMVVDGTGAPPREADVAITGDVFSAIGSRLASAGARRVIDARGLCVAPGFIDVHTHYDVQVFWDPLLTPSSWHGVTSVVVGNCGFGIAPCRPQAREALSRLLAHVEGMSLSVIQGGGRWSFATFADYLDAVAASGVAINLGALVGHSPLRLDTLGDEASEREATREEIAVMRAAVVEAMRAGAIGFATSTAEVHVDQRGRPAPSRLASADEMRELAAATGESGRGLVMIAKGSGTSVADLEGLAEASGRPIVWAGLLHRDATPERTWQTLAAVEASRARGLPIRPQVSCRPLVMTFTMESPYPFEGLPSWRQVHAAPPGQRGPVYASEEFRASFRADLKPERRPFFHGRWSDVWVARTEHDKHRALEGRSIEDVARLAARDPIDALFDLALAEDLRTEFRVVLLNSDDDGVARLLRHPATLIALSDGGAHQDIMCDAGYCSTLLGKWVREKRVLSLSEAVRRLTSEPADLYGISGRGRIVAGAFADLAVFDASRVRALPLERVRDLPGGEPRLVSRCEGMRYVVVNGCPLLEDGQVAGGPRRPGRVLRGAAPTSR